MSLSEGDRTTPSLNDIARLGVFPLVRISGAVVVTNPYVPMIKRTDPKAAFQISLPNLVSSAWDYFIEIQ